MAKSTIGFSIYLNGKLIDEIKVDRPVFNVGKLSTSTLRLDDVNVSRKHAVIELREDGKWRITDLGSTNGTILRGERVEQSELHDGDRLLIGRTTLVVHIDEAPSGDAAAAAAAYTAPATVSGTSGDAQAAGDGEATKAIRPEELLASKPKPAAAPAGAAVPRPVNKALEAWATSRPPAPTQARGFHLPRGTVGHIITIIGALLFVVGSAFLPWQRFELADLSLKATEVNLFGLIVTVLGASTLVASVWGLVTGHRHAAARYNLIVGIVGIVWLVVAATQLNWGTNRMLYEQVSLQVGYLIAAWGVLVILGGAGVTFGSLPHWDESTSFLRVLVSRENRPVHDMVVYEPGTVDLAAELASTELGQSDLLAKMPRFRVTREGDTFMSLAPDSSKLLFNNRERSASEFMAKAKNGPDGKRYAPILHGDRGSVEVGDARVLFLFVKPIAGRGQVALTSWTEGAAFGVLMVLLAISLALYTIIGWDVDAVRDFKTDDKRLARVELITADDKKEEEKERVVQVEVTTPEITIPEKTDIESEKFGDDEENPEEPIGEKEDMRDRTSELVDMLNPRNNEPIDLSKLSPNERAEKAREIAQQTALAQTFREDNPLFAQIMTINPDVDSRLNVLAALDGQGSTFIAGAVDPFGGTLSSGGGFPGGMDGGGLPTGGPNGGGPAIAGAFDRGGPRNLDDVRFNERPLEPKIVEQPPRLSGELDAKTVQQYIRRYLSGIKWCYQDRLQANRKLGGKLTLAFTILPNGSVTDARAANSTLGDAALEQCIGAKMARWRFPSPKDGGVVDVAYPLILKTQ